MMMQHCPKCGTKFKAGDQACMQCGFVFPFATDMLAEGRMLQGRYEIIKLIHSGGMGYIYLARDNRLEREVVVKQIRQAVKSESHRQKLEEEALKMAAISHPGVAMVFDHFVEDDFYFLVVEYIRGRTLAETYEEKGGHLEEGQVISWMVPVCEVIGYLHWMDMVHRDISPDNIMLTEDGQIKLIDFGTLHELGMIAGKRAGKEGKFGFTPKEQWDGHPLPQSDVFALGATLYYLLTGYLPQSERYKQNNRPEPEDYEPVYPSIRELRPDLTEGLEQVLSRALSQEAERRYADAAEMCEAFNNLSGATYSGSSGAVLGKGLITDNVRIDSSGATIVDGVKPKQRWLAPVIVGITGVVLIGLGVIFSGVLTPPPPKLDVAADSVSFDELKPKETSRNISRVIKNSGGKMLTGNISSDAKWLHTDTGQIKLAPGENTTINFWVDTHDMAYGALAAANLIVKTDGGEAKIPVSVAVTRTIFYDDFSDPNSGWDTGKTPHGDRQYSKGGYTVTCRDSEWVVYGYRDALGELENYVVEFDATPTTGSSKGSNCWLKFHWKDSGNYYAFILMDTMQGYQFGRVINGKWETLNQGKDRSFINKRSKNTVRLICKGYTIDAYVNGALVLTKTDYSLFKGEILIGVNFEAVENTYFEYGEYTIDNFKLQVP